MKLVIVESPAKAKTINKYLGSDYNVLASYGHIRDLPAKKGSVDPEQDFMMTWEQSPSSTKPFREIKEALKKSDELILATDPDREGEAISWHVWRMLDEQKVLKDKTVHRVVFNEITKSAITKAVDNPREIDINLVNAQQARRVLDRLVGFELSPILWKKVKYGLSAGRVQSVAVRLIVEREKDINTFISESSYKVSALFLNTDQKVFKADLPKRFKLKEEAVSFLKTCLNSTFTISTLNKKLISKFKSLLFPL